MNKVIEKLIVLIVISLCLCCSESKTNEVFRITPLGNTSITDQNYMIDIFWRGERVAFINEDLVWVVIDSIATLKAISVVAETLEEYLKL